MNGWYSGSSCTEPGDDKAAARRYHLKRSQFMGALFQCSCALSGPQISMPGL